MEKTKRVNLLFPLWLFNSLVKLGKLRGLNVTNTIRYCCAKVIEQELDPKDRTQK